jgi:XTP/dITP diphosphohydrolase
MRAILAGIPFRLRTLREFPAVVMPPEDGASHADNAVIKARAVALATGRLALADDSGLEVDALGGRPGVRSARYGGPGLEDADRVHLLLDALRDVPPGQRTARFRCAIAVCDPGGRAHVVEGTVEGLILGAPRGSGGFGYDPIFYHPGSAGTFAELPDRRKNAISHRSVALSRARELLVALRLPGAPDGRR